MVRKITCFSSTTIRVVFALPDVVVVAVVSTLARPFLIVAAHRTIELAGWAGSCDCLLRSRGVRNTGRFGSLVFALLASFAFGFGAGAAGSFYRTNDIVSPRTFVAARALACRRHLCASHFFLVDRCDGWNCKARLVSF